MHLKVKVQMKNARVSEACQTEVLSNKNIEESGQVDLAVAGSDKYSQRKQVTALDP